MLHTILPQGVMVNRITENLKGISRFFTQNQLDPCPLRHSLRQYKVSYFADDFRAGLNVALLAFPQGMAYAAIAGLPIEYGIYGSAVAAIAGTFLAGSRFIALGPTNATSVLLFASFLGLGATMQEKQVMLPFILLMTGLFLIVGAFFKVATMIQFISRSVATGYITAAAIYIVVNQMRKIMGVHFEIPQGSTFFDVIRLTLEHIPESHPPSLFLSAVTALVYIILQRYFRTLPNVAITLVTMSAFSVGMHALMERLPEAAAWLGGRVDTLKSIDASEWPVTWPEINDTLLSDLAPIALVIAFLSILEGTSIGKSLAARSGERLDSNQEMLNMGMANLGCAFFGGMPASGSLTRSQLNWSSGARTQLSSLCAGLICAAGAFVLGPLTHYIPTAALGVLVVSIGVSLVNSRVIGIIMKSTRSDALVFIVTFVAALLIRLDFAILIGVSLSIMLFLRKAAAPELVEYSFTEEGQLAQLQQERPDPEVSIVHVEGDLFFAASEMFRDQVRRIYKDPNLKIVILKLRNAHHIDATCVLAMEELIRTMNEDERYLILSEVREEVKSVLDNSGITRLIGEDNVLMDVANNPTLSTAKAVKRAHTILGGKQGRVSIYVNPAKRTPRED